MENKYYQIALDYIAKTDISSLPNGKYVIDRDNVWVNVIETELRPISEARLEAHNEFLDIHIPISGPECYGVKNRSECMSAIGEIDLKDDIIFYNDEISDIITGEAGKMTVFLPDTAHAPLIGSGRIRKAIFKVRVG